MTSNKIECPNCGYSQGENDYECPRCGIIFHKHKVLLEKSNYRIIYTEEIPQESELDKGIIFSIPSAIDPINFGIRVIIFIILVYYTFYLVPAPLDGTRIGEILLHNVNLVFHEAGHVFFSPFGEIIASLGGSLMQLIIPLIVFLVFLLKNRDGFGASVGFWWLGENFLDIAPYIYDASRLELPLLGYESGKDAPYGYHDWNFILTELNLISYDHTIASVVKAIGVIIMLVALLWAGIVLLKTYSLVKKQP